MKNILCWSSNIEGGGAGGWKVTQGHSPNTAPQPYRDVIRIPLGIQEAHKLQKLLFHLSYIFFFRKMVLNYILSTTSWYCEYFSDFFAFPASIQCQKIKSPFTSVP